jgi:DNA polymerase-3 subunit gamma/tau
MFENILRQPGVVSRLTAELTSDLLPPGLLFHGPQYSGKLTTALELARALTCERDDAPWNCRCTSCKQQRVLLQPNTLMLGSRYFLQEIEASGRAVQQHPRDATAYLFIRAVRKLLRRFDPVLWSEDEGRLQKVESPLASMEEQLAHFVPGSSQPVPERVDEVVQSIVKEAGKVVSTIASENIPVHVVRSMTYWARLTSNVGRKIVIIENADRMQEGARNALLKILEEPPEGVYLILLSTTRQAVIPTVASRVRHYGFAGRGSEETQEVLSRIFREPNLEYSSLREYFVKQSLAGADTLEELASRFLDLAREPGEPDVSVLHETASAMRAANWREAFRYFAESMLSEISRRMKQGTIDVRVAEAWNTSVGEALHRGETLNIGLASVLEWLLHRMRHA